MNIKMIAGFGLFIIVYTSINTYIGWNLYVWLKTAFQIENILLLTVFIGFLSYAYLFEQLLKKFPSLKMIGAFWFGCFQFGFVVLPIVNLLVWLLSLIGLPTDNLIIGAGFLTWALFFSYIGVGLYNAYQPVVKKYDIQVPRKKAKRRSIRIAAASDLHFGGLSGKNHARRLVQTINTIDADLVLFPGDLIDDDPNDFKKKRMDRTLKKINAGLGSFGVLGNHEYYGGKIKELTKIMKNSHVTILQDQSVLIDNSLQIIGRKDKTDRHRKSVKELIIPDNKSFPQLVLDHQPSELNAIMEQGADIVICGHTHRGQITPNQYITKKIFEVDYGYKLKGNLHVIVSSGFGFWGPPLRIGSRSEVLQIDVTFV